MSPRNLLLVTYHFPPSAASGAFRMLGFARHLPRYGWGTTVVAPPSLPWEPVDPELARRVPDETTVIPVPYAPSKVARRLAPMGCWLPHALAACQAAVREHRPDAVLTSGPPHLVHYLGLALRRRHGLPWVADFRDPWSPPGRLDRGHDLASRRLAWQEGLVVRSADAVVANAPGACQNFCATYPGLAAKFVTIPNGYDREAFAATPPTPRAPGSPIRVVHTGAIYCGRDPRPFLDALRLLSESRPCPGPLADFFGPPPEFEFDFADELARRALTGRVTVHGQVPYARCLREMASADVLLLMDTPGRKVGVPAKVYEYIGAGRPVLALGERGGDLEWVLERSGVAYRIAPPDDPARIAADLADLGRAPVLTSGKRRGAERFSREAIAGELAELLDGTLRDRRAVSPTVSGPPTRREEAPVEVGGPLT